jgi:hypothetical protein
MLLEGTSGECSIYAFMCHAKKIRTTVAKKGASTPTPANRDRWLTVLRNDQPIAERIHGNTVGLPIDPSRVRIILAEGFSTRRPDRTGYQHCCGNNY